MKQNPPALILFIIIVLEGYVVLSSELLAIRQTIPFIGSGTDTVSIIIAAVLMPLAFGYHAGGRFRPGFSNGKFISIRDKLIQNIYISHIFIVFGISYVVMEIFFDVFRLSGIQNRLILTTLYSVIFLVVPVYLLGQTIPLISNYFKGAALSRLTGKILFFSTLGSFLGAVFSTLVLMSTIGVHNTVALNYVILTFLVILLSKKKITFTIGMMVAFTALGLALNSNWMMDQLGIVENNKYNTIKVKEQDNERLLIINNNLSSKYSDDGRKHEYIEFAESQTIERLEPREQPYKILVIGAGAFTFGADDKKNIYHYVDIDYSLKDIAEEHILKKPLLPNKIFYAEPARGFLSRTKHTYDIVLLDAYFGDLTIPEQLVTQEFFQQVRSVLKPGSIIVSNFITTANFSDTFSRHLDNTLRTVFPHLSRHVIGQNYTNTNNEKHELVNVMYIYTHHPDANTNHIYTDDKNTIFLDKPQVRF